ncbi:MAG: DUF1080 domain-containing protein [Planctomycetaceae bacterium]|nr:DUF1080 domain-containing protein [Planctomycetaceae bacterium]
MLHLKNLWKWVFLPCLGGIMISSLCLAAEGSTTDGFTPLFNGKDIDGWIKHGGKATYSVDRGCIVGKRGDDAENTFLCSPKKYGNFILKFECKFDIPINSGVQIRSDVRPEGDRVFGYQVEMDQTTPFSGRIYDEGRRGRWLCEPASEESGHAFKKDEWNTFVVQCVGPSIKTWVNGVLCSDMIDTMDLSGFIALQVHASQEEGQVRWRNIMIEELPESVWQPLLKKDFEGLWVSPSGKWELSEDLIAKGTSEKGEERDGMLKCETIYPDLAARVTFKQVNGNSGLYFRAVEVEKPYWLRGFQDEIDRDATASLWEVEGRGWVAKNNEAAKTVFKEGDWNTVSIVAVGDRLVTNLNGLNIVDIIDPECLKEGKVALQLHGGSDMEYYFKDFDVLVISPEQRAMIEQKECPATPDKITAKKITSANQRVIFKHRLRDLSHVKPQKKQSPQRFFKLRPGGNFFPAR